MNEEMPQKVQSRQKVTDGEIVQRTIERQKLIFQRSISQITTSLLKNVSYKNF